MMHRDYSRLFSFYDEPIPFKRQNMNSCHTYYCRRNSVFQIILESVQIISKWFDLSGLFWSLYSLQWSGVKWKLKDLCHWRWRTPVAAAMCAHYVLHSFTSPTFEQKNAIGILKLILTYSWRNSYTTIFRNRVNS